MSQHVYTSHTVMTYAGMKEVHSRDLAHQCLPHAQGISSEPTQVTQGWNPISGLNLEASRAYIQPTLAFTCNLPISGPGLVLHCTHAHHTLPSMLTFIHLLGSKHDHACYTLMLTLKATKYQTRD
ncbi:hypothetical protein RJT34_16418 [Clitoria ternatea]|uniref:Uncharacterized protein n=1 Tax=Clitoria ternatea TaxID=43366 RepID=A0AAN9J742_CLITE